MDTTPILADNMVAYKSMILLSLKQYSLVMCAIIIFSKLICC